jgi:hypothetical protein
MPDNISLASIPMPGTNYVYLVMKVGDYILAGGDDYLVKVFPAANPLLPI